MLANHIDYLLIFKEKTRDKMATYEAFFLSSWA